MRGFRTLRQALSAWRADRRGNVAVIFALCMPVVAGGAALSVETSYHYYKHVRLQAAADAAAYSAGLQKVRGSNYAAIQAAAQTAAAENGWLAGSGSIQVNTPPASGSNTVPAAIEVILTQTEPRFFSAILTNAAVNLGGRAVALTQVASNACVLALSKTASQAVDIQGSSQLNLTGCDVVSNSVANDALNVWGAAKLSADCALSVGGITNKAGLVLSKCPGGVTQAMPAQDPFASLPAPTPSGGCKNDNASALTAGWYCNGMTLKNNVTLAPGTYYVSGGDFQVNANAVVSGSGVTIYLSGNARVRMNGNATINLSAPTSGTYAGVLFFGDRASSGGSNTFNGDGSSSFTGDLYFPTQNVTYNGNFSGSGGCTHIIGDTVNWSGSVTLSVDCSASGMANIPAQKTVRLVE